MEDKGQIYLLHCKTSGKNYIGQALCYVSNGRLGKKKWGAEGRWKSHTQEALGNSKDHCSLLNSAIRKYGEENFSVKILCEQPIEMLDDLEKNYINIYNSLVPNGYNLTNGGAKGKDSDETREKKRQMRLGKKNDPKTKLYISLGQFGKRRKNNNENLPLFVYKYGNDYWIRYPVIENDNLKLLKENYKRSKETAITRAQELDNIYKTSTIILKIIKEKEELMKEKRRNKKLPKNIIPLYENKKKIGYVVNNLKDNNGKILPDKNFSNHKSNARNLNDAEKYIKQVQNNDLKAKYDLPKYMLIFNQKINDKITEGFIIQKVPLKNSDDSISYITKKFTNMSLSMDQKYDLVINYYNSLNLNS